VDPAKAAGLRALGALGPLAALAAAVGHATAATHDARGAALNRALFAAAVRDAQAAGLGRLGALGEPAPARRACGRRVGAARMCHVGTFARCLPGGRRAFATHM
jgi:hypothetical protein